MDNLLARHVTFTSIERSTKDDVDIGIAHHLQHPSLQVFQTLVPQVLERPKYSMFRASISR